MLRVAKNLSTGERAGDVVADDHFPNHIANALLRKGALTRMASPPLAEIEGWTLRASKLRVAGIITVEHFLDAPPERVVAALGHKTDRAYKQYRAELLAISRPPERRRRSRR